MSDTDDGRICIELLYQSPGHPLHGSRVTVVGAADRVLWDKAASKARSIYLSYRVYGNDHPRHLEAIEGEPPSTRP